MTDKEHNSLIIKKCLDEDCEKSNIFEYYYADKYCDKNSKKIQQGEWESLPVWTIDGDGEFSQGSGKFIKDKDLFQNVRRIYWDKGSFIDSKGSKYDYIYMFDPKNPKPIIKKLNSNFNWDNHNLIKRKIKKLKTYDYCILKSPFAESDKTIDDNNNDFRNHFT